MASDTLMRIGDRSDLRGNARANDSLDAGFNASLSSNLVVRKGGLLQSGVRVTGNMTLGRGLVRIGSAQVTGAVMTNQVVDRCVFTGDPVVPGTVDRIIAGLQNLAPGDYRDIRVQSGAILHLGPGLYRVRRLIVDPDGILEMDAEAGAVEIEVSEGFSFASRARIRGTSGMSDSLAATKFSIYSHQTADLRIETDAFFRGRLRAPRATVYLGSRTSFLGGVYARQLVIEPDVVFRDALVASTSQIVRIDGPRRFWTNASQVAVSWTIDGMLQSTQTTEPLASEGGHRIIRCSGSACDTVLAMVDRTPPVIRFSSPAEGALLNTPAVDLAWTIDGVVQNERVQLIEGSNTLIRTATDSASNTGAATLHLTLDTQPPVVSIVTPSDGLLTNQPSQVVQWLVDGVEHTDQVELAEGQNLIERQATDAAGNTAAAQVHVVLDTKPPVVTFVAPVDGFVTNQPKQTLKWLVDGIERTEEIELVEGENLLERQAGDAAGNIGRAQVRLVLDTKPPVVSILSPKDGSTVNLTPIAVQWTVDGVLQTSGITEHLAEGLNTIHRSATDAAGNAGSASIQVNYVLPVAEAATFLPTAGRYHQTQSISLLSAVPGAQIRYTLDGTDPTESSPLFLGSILAERSVQIKARVFAPGYQPSSVSAALYLVAPENVLPEPVAPPNNPTVATDFAESYEFLYQGPQAVQKDVVLDSLDSRRLCVLKGVVIDRSGAPLSGVQVTVHGHPEFGSTESRIAGDFDLAANGGGDVTLEFRKVGYLSSQRRIETPWLDFALVDTVAMVALDPEVTAVDLTSDRAPTFAQGSVVTDKDGVRRGTLFFPTGLSAEMEMPDGTRRALTSLNVRVTEYTVGENGLAAMPGALPPTSAYTYAAELSVDEAVAAGAEHVVFSKPVSFYLDNFLGFPVGVRVPVGWYDRKRSVWVPEPDGRIIQLLGRNGGGLMEIDINGDGSADGEDSLAKLSITAEERDALARQWESGKVLWRLALRHFSPIDPNFPAVLPEDAKEPDTVPPPPPPPDSGNCPDEGCEIGTEAQNLREMVSIPGTDLELVYSLDRTNGSLPRRTLDIPLSRGPLPERLRRIDLEISVLGRKWSYSFPRQAGQVFQWQWDGKDAYGRPFVGAANAWITIDYVYDLVYAGTPEGAASFSYTNGIAINEFLRGRRDGKLSRTFVRRLQGGAPDLGFGNGWGVSGLHWLNAGAKVWLDGDGGERSQPALSSSLKRIAGNGQIGFAETGAALETSLSGTGWPLSMTFGADGSLYYLSDYRIKVIGKDHNVKVLAGVDYNLGSQYWGDSAALDTAFIYPFADMRPGRIRVTSNNDVYFTNMGCELDVVKNGWIYRVLGDKADCDSHLFHEGDMAKDTRLGRIQDFVVAQTGDIYLRTRDMQKIFKIDPSGRIHTVVGTDHSSQGGDINRQDSLVGTNFSLQWDGGIPLTLDLNGNLVFNAFSYLYRLDADGYVRKFAGYYYGNDNWRDGDSIGAVSIYAGFTRDLFYDRDGYLYLDHRFGGPADGLWRINRKGFLERVISRGTRAVPTEANPIDLLEGSDPYETPLHEPLYAMDPSGDLHAYDYITNCIWKRSGLSEKHTVVSNGELYSFDLDGRLESVRDARAGWLKQSYSYDDRGLLASMSGLRGDVLFERDGAGLVQAVIAPTGERTEVIHDAEGNVSEVRLPSGESWQFKYYPNGLLREIARPQGEVSTYTYDALGQLLSDTRNDGATQVIAPWSGDGNREVVLSLLDGTQKRYETMRMPDGTERRVTTTANGDRTITRDLKGRQRLDSLPDGAVRLTRVHRDPQWGLLHELEDVITMQPDGRIDTLLHRRGVVLADPRDPLSLVEDFDSTIESGGRITVMNYNAGLRRQIKTYPEGRADTTYFDEKGLIIEFRTTAMYPVVYSYDNRGNRTHEHVRTPLGQLLKKRSVYNALNRLVEEWEQPDPAKPEVMVAGYSYDAAGRMLSRTDGEGRTWQYRYDQWGNRNLEIAPDGATTFAVYNELGQRIVNYDAIQMSKPEGARKAQRWFYDVAGRDTLHIDVLGRKSRKSYDALGNLVMEIGVHQDTTRRGFDKDGRVIWERSPLGRLTYQQYDVMGRVTHVIRKVGDVEPMPDDDDQVTEYEYDLRGNQTREIVDGRIVSRRGYDAFDRLVAGTNAAGIVTGTEYDAAGRPWRTARSDGSWQESHFDGLGRVDFVEDALGLMHAQRYNMANRVLESRTPGQGSIQTFYDRSGLPSRIVDSAGIETLIRRDAAGRDTMAIDGLGHASIKRLDLLGRPRELIDARGFVQSMEYDELGRLSRLLDAGDQDGDGQRHATQFLYEDLDQPDAVERRTTLYPDGTREIEESDAEGQITRRVDARGVETRIQFNALGQQTRLDLRDPATGQTSATIFTYDPQTHQLVSVQKGATEVVYVYRGDGRLESETQNVMGQSHQLRYGYDDHLRQRTVIHPDGNAVIQRYDERSRLSQVSVGGVSLAHLEYEAMRLKSRLLGNGIVATYQYDRAGKVTGFGYERTGVELPHFGVTYDAAGRINSLRREHMPASSETFGYTEDGQLSAWKVGAVGSDGAIGAPAQFQEWPGLDSRGNWRTWRENGRTETREHSEMNELSTRIGGGSSIPLSYTGGYLQNDGRFRYEWTLEGLLSAMRTTSGQLVAQYEYDGLGRRVGKVLAGGTRTVSVYAGQQCVWQVSTPTAGEDTVKSFAYGTYIDEPVAMIRKWGSSSDTSYFLQGNNYNVEALTDRSGAIVERYEYTPYGEPTVYTGKGVDGKWYTSDDVTSSRSARGNDVLFQGRSIDWESGLYYYRARMYSPGLGRFISRDPLRFGGGDMNLFRAFNNSPHTSLDPDGKFTRSVSLSLGEYGQITGSIKSFLRVDYNGLGGLSKWGGVVIRLSYNPGNCTKCDDFRWRQVIVATESTCGRKSPYVDNTLPGTNCETDGTDWYGGEMRYDEFSISDESHTTTSLREGRGLRFEDRPQREARAFSRQYWRASLKLWCLSNKSGDWVPVGGFSYGFKIPSGGMNIFEVR